MRRVRPFLCSVAFTTLISLLPVSGHAQQWSGIISPSRATDWSTAGVQGGIPNRLTNCVTTACNTLFGGTVSAASINAALSSAPAGTVVRIPAGTFTLASGGGGIIFGQSNITLRGAGADQTKLIINDTSSGCHLFYSSAVLMCTGSGATGGGGPAHTATWTGTTEGGANQYPVGATHVTMSSTTGLNVGMVLFLDQLNDASDGWPATGDIYVCDNSANNCSNQGGNSYARANRAQTQVVGVTAINGGTVAIDPPLCLPNWRSSQSPGAYWNDVGDYIQNSGIEAMSIDFTGGGGAGIEMVRTQNSWVKGVRLLQTGGPGSFVFHILPVQAYHDSFVDNYLYGPNVQGNTQYQYTPHVAGMLLYQNNIMQRVVSGMLPNDPITGSVYAYNFVTGSYYAGPGEGMHNAGDMMNLFEGNDDSGFLGDVIHGTHFFNTMFRVLYDGHKNNPPGNENASISLHANNRFFNVVGSVLGDSSYINTYQSLLADSGTAIYVLGWQGSGSGLQVTNDTNVARTLMRWANWDVVTNNTRFCGNSSNAGWIALCGLTSEIPSAITNFPNPIPTKGDTAIGQPPLPPSFYLNSKPLWFGSVAWPPVGPDVTGGNISGYAGHANKIPARSCYENSVIDSAYGASNIRVFNANTCYPSVAASAPPPPSNLQAVVQ